MSSTAAGLKDVSVITSCLRVSASERAMAAMLDKRERN
jgi:hypothetical protein